MRVVHSLNVYKPSFLSLNGITIYVENLVNYMKKNHEICVCSANISNLKGNKIFKKTTIKKEEGIFKLYLDSLTLKNRGGFINYFPIGFYNKGIQRLINQYDIFHIHGYRNFLSFLISKFALKKNKPYVIQPHGSIPILSGKKNTKKIFDYFFGYIMLKKASAVIAMNSYEENFYKKLGINKDKIFLVGNGINLEEIQKVNIGAFRKKLGIESDSKIIMYLGRINKTKNIDIIINLANKLILNNKSFKFKIIIIGPDEGDLSRLKKLAKKLNVLDSVYFYGPIYDIKSKYSALNDADIFIQPSKLEGFPTNVIEALALGKPVVVNYSKLFRGVYDAIKGKAGYVGDLLNYDRVINFINKILLDQRLYNKYSTAAKLLVKEKYSMDKIASDFITIYSICLKKGRCKNLFS